MELFPGGRYGPKNGGYGLRVIEGLHGDDVYWADSVGGGRCSRSTFKKNWTFSPDSPVPAETPKRTKRISQEAIEAIMKELAVIRQLRVALSGVQVQSVDTEKQAAIGLGLWQLGLMPFGNSGLPPYLSYPS